MPVDMRAGVGLQGAVAARRHMLAGGLDWPEAGAGLRHSKRLTLLIYWAGYCRLPRLSSGGQREPLRRTTFATVSSQLFVSGWSQCCRSLSTICKDSLM